jgi:hypothetical protein
LCDRRQYTPQLGSHDSELAIVMEDQDLIDSQMNGQPYRASRLRLGVTYPIIDVGTAANDCAIVDNTHFAVHVQLLLGRSIRERPVMVSTARIP